MKDLRNYESDLGRMAGLNIKHSGCVRMIRIHIAILPESTIGELTRICEKMYPKEVTPIHPGLWFVAKAKIGEYLLNHSRHAGESLTRTLQELWGEQEEI